MTLPSTPVSCPSSSASSTESTTPNVSRAKTKEIGAAQLRKLLKAMAASD